MAEQLIYDPRTKELIKTKIYEFLYNPVNKDFSQRLRAIITKNSVLHGNAQEWVSFKGVYYSFEDVVTRPRPVNRLKPELKPLMNEYLEDLQRLNDHELPYVLGFINQVLNASNSIQDYFKIFPQSTHKPIQELIDKCGCRQDHLGPDVVLNMTESNAVPIELMKKRMVLNLLI